MLKFILYMLLFYVIFRYVFGGLFKVKVYNFNNYQQGSPETKEEGTITIKDTGSGKSNSSNNNIGEYVDFEEVK